MDTYTEFSTVYDYLLKHVDYEYWYKYIRTLMCKYTESQKRILEIGCGTGKFGAKFSRDNSLIYGMDKSMDMLQIAKVRAQKKYRIFCGDMTDFYLSKKFDFIFCVHDTMNYLLTYKDIQNTLKCVKNIMHDKSIFLFDITTEHNIKINFDGQSSFYSVRGIEVEWTNEYDKKKKHVYSVLKFVKNGNVIGFENHIQRIYTISEIEKILDKEGFKIHDIFSDYSLTPANNDAVMINFITGI